jgi:hypothetical protein
MADEFMDYPNNGTVDDLCSTCGGDEDVFRGPLTKLERVVDTKGNQGIRATYAPLPFTKKYAKKRLVMFDITNMSTKEQTELAKQQIAQGNAEAFKGQVYLGGKPATVVVYREAIKKK